MDFVLRIFVAIYMAVHFSNVKLLILVRWGVFRRKVSGLVQVVFMLCSTRKGHLCVAAGHLVNHFKRIVRSSIR
ncbi:hypothetical protein QVD17_14094 [Tagetes erecta]|uniref:Uncharacterized protein n=1 Tax=Tagetes erecta TaxID=13708 RepID=A0AAD8P3R9_TARER|nr:hypothetical protein QVD17_14094 [Tagetes erecta]